MARVKFTEQDILNAKKRGTIASHQEMLFDSNTAPEMNDLFHDEQYYRLMQLMNTDNAFFYPGNVPSLKNSQEVQTRPTGTSICCNVKHERLGVGQFKCPKCGTINKEGRKLVQLKMSDRASNYMDIAIRAIMSDKKRLWYIIDKIGYPIHLGIYFIRDSNHEFDFDNAITMICDCIKNKKSRKLGIIEKKIYF